MAKIYFQRHTKPLVEPQICYGVSDLALDKGYSSRDLPEVLDRLEGVNIEQIYTSPLKRCFILACDIKQAKEVKNITIDNRLKELNFGDWEMMKWNDIYTTPQGKAWFDDFLHTPTLNGESFMMMVERVKEFIYTIKCSDKNVMIVTHSGVIRAAMVIAEMATPEEVFGAEINYGDLIEIDL